MSTMALAIVFSCRLSVWCSRGSGSGILGSCGLVVSLELFITVTGARVTRVLLETFVARARYSRYLEVSSHYSKVDALLQSKGGDM